MEDVFKVNVADLDTVIGSDFSPLSLPTLTYSVV